MRRTLARLAATLSSTALVSALAVTLAAPAQAAPPVVVDDELTIHANTVHFPDLLANDSDPDDDELKICRIREVVDPPVAFIDFLGSPVVFAEPGTSGVFELTYYACDYETLVPGTLRVTVKPSPKADVAVKKLPKRPGKVRVTNRSSFPLQLAWGHAGSLTDGKTMLGKKKSTVISVRRTAIAWGVYNDVNGAERFGFLKGIKLPKKVKKLPPSPRPRATVTSVDDLLAARTLGTQALRSPLHALRQR